MCMPKKFIGMCVVWLLIMTMRKHCSSCRLEEINFINEKYRRSSIALETEGESYTSHLKTDPWFDGDETKRQLQLAIDSLPDKQKQVFVRRYYDEMKYEEMEAILGTTTGALKASYHHAVKKIEIFLKERLNQI